MLQQADLTKDVANYNLWAGRVSRRAAASPRHCVGRPAGDAGPGHWRALLRRPEEYAARRTRGEQACELSAITPARPASS